MRQGYVTSQKLNVTLDVESGTPTSGFQQGKYFMHFPKQFSTHLLKFAILDGKSLWRLRRTEREGNSMTVCTVGRR